MLYLIFVFFLLLEDLLLPALIGPGPFLAVQTFILAVIIYSKGYKGFLFYALPLILVKEFISGISTGDLLIPFIITSLLYLLANRFFYLTDNLSEDYSFSGFMISSLVLILFNYVYAWFFILHNAAYYDISQTWNYWKGFWGSSLFSTLGWSVAISAIFKFIILGFTRKAYLQ